MTKKEKVEHLLTEAGFQPDGFGFRIVRGPKVKMDILECWSTGASNAFQNGRHVEICSAYTMSVLAKRGLKVVPNYPETCLYGDFVAVPLKPLKRIA